MEDKPLPFIAYDLCGAQNPAIFRAPPRREWMDLTSVQFAYRCLPLVIANQSGWMIPNAVAFTAIWNGGKSLPDLRVMLDPGQHGYGGWAAEHCVISHFGEGVLTFVLPYLFRTPPGYNLWVKGPANCFKDAIQALEGVIETDWSHATFTMNWRFTRPNHAIRFEVGEPICQLVPYPRGLLERLQPEVRSLAQEPDVALAFQKWSESRRVFSEQLKVSGSEAQRRGWEKGYIKGELPDGDRFEGHQTSLKLKDFGPATQ
jgi:hypothetical protein